MRQLANQITLKNNEIIAIFAPCANLSPFYFIRPYDHNPSVHAQPHKRAPYCQNRRMQGHTALEYCSQPLTEIWVEPNVS